MISHVLSNDSHGRPRTRISGLVIWPALAGLGCYGLFTTLGFKGAAGAWSLLVTAVALLGSGLFNAQRQGESAAGLLISGQLLGVIGTGMLLVYSLS